MKTPDYIDYHAFRKKGDKVYNILNTVLPKLSFIVNDFSFWENYEPKVKITKEMDLLEIRFAYYHSLIILPDKIYIKSMGADNVILTYDNWDGLLNYIERMERR